MPDSPLALYLRSVAANLRRLRLRRGLTQEALAERAGLDLSYEQRVERGATNLSMSVLVALARALGFRRGYSFARLVLRRCGVVGRGRDPARRRDSIGVEADATVAGQRELRPALAPVPSLRRRVVKSPSGPDPDGARARPRPSSESTPVPWPRVASAPGA